MKRIQLLVLFLFLVSVITTAQQKRYVSYIVKKGETIKSIAKDYNLSTRDLLKLNPDVGRKPKANTVIIVPNKNSGLSQTSIKAVNENLYLVKKKETLFGISKAHGITVAELKAANPILEEGLKIGMKLIIPESAKAELISSKKYVLHTVVKDDTFYNLSKRYLVSREALLSLNPSLSEGLKLGMVLKIKPINERSESVKVEEGEVEFEEFTEVLNLSRSINVAIMLPYQLEINQDSVMIDNFDKSNSILNIATDFHLGALMAIDSLKSKGVQINVTCFDTENSKYKLQSILGSSDFNATDVVIGPIFFDKALWLSKNIKSPVIAPFYSKKQEVFSNNNLIKSVPNPELFEEHLLSYMKKQYKGENIIILNDGKEETQHKLWQTVNTIKTFDSIQNVAVIKSTEGYIDNEKIAEKLVVGTENWVLLVTDDNVITPAAVNNLKLFIEDFNITLFSFNKGKNFSKIGNSFLGELNFVFATSDYLDMEDASVKRFFEKYNAKNYSMPSKYAIRGFDVTYDVLARIATKENLANGLHAGFSKRVASIFNYEKKLFGNFENKGVYLIQYNKELEAVILN